MFERFFPDEYVVSTYVIPFEKLYEQGYRGVIFDIDNTLVPHGAPADERAKKLFQRLEDIGFHSCLISNNQEPRVKMFNQDIGTEYIYNAHKPSTKNYIYGGVTNDNLAEGVKGVLDMHFVGFIFGHGNSPSLIIVRGGSTPCCRPLIAYQQRRAGLSTTTRSGVHFIVDWLGLLCYVL